MTLARAAAPATVGRGYAPARAGERWCCRVCRGCEKRRMMPEVERTCLRCQETGGAPPPRDVALAGLGAARERAGLSREELGALIGMDRYRLHLVEAGLKRVRVKTARRVAAAVGTTVDVLAREPGGAEHERSAPRRGAS